MLWLLNFAFHLMKRLRAALACLKSVFKLSTNASRKYIYKPLEFQSQIRIVELLPRQSSNSNFIYCRIHHMDLDMPLFEYTAVSYTWGDTSMAARKEVVVVGEGTILVTPNLHSCLSRLRQQEGSVILWVDGISIDQGTEEDAIQERNVQVSMMHRIFSEAREVLVELGAVPGDDDILMQGLEQLSLVDCREFEAVLAIAKERYCLNMEHPPMSRYDWKQKRKHHLQFEALLSTLDIPKPSDPFWPAFTRLLRRPYFYRIWIVQEVALAKTIRYHLGNHFLLEDLFREATHRALEYHLVRRHLSLQYRSLFTLLAARFRVHLDFCLVALQFCLNGFKITASEPHRYWAYQNAFGIDLDGIRVEAQHRAYFPDLWNLEVSHVLEPELPPLAVRTLYFRFCYCHCSDPRDRVYGLLGLADDRDSPELYVDYNESVAELSLRLSKHMVNQGLAMLLLYRPSHKDAGTPSWAISLEEIDGETDLLSACVGPWKPLDKNPFSACGSTEFLCRLALANEHHLVTRGTVVATVTSQSVPFPMSPLDTFAKGSVHSFVVVMGTWGAQVSKWIGEIHTMAARGRSESDTRLRWFRTISADLRYDEHGKPDRVGTGAQALAYFETVEYFFTEFTTLGLMGMFAKDQMRKLEQSRSAWPLLLKVLAGRRLGVAQHYDGKESRPELQSALHASEVDPWLCQLPAATVIGDEIAVINGCPIPFVLREDANSNTFRIVGSCYVDGIMDGELFEHRRWRERELTIS